MFKIHLSLYYLEKHTWKTGKQMRKCPEENDQIIKVKKKTKGGKNILEFGLFIPEETQGHVQVIQIFMWNKN